HETSAGGVARLPALWSRRHRPAAMASALQGAAAPAMPARPLAAGAARSAVSCPRGRARHLRVNTIHAPHGCPLGGAQRFTVAVDVVRHGGWTRRQGSETGSALALLACVRVVGAGMEVAVLAVRHTREHLPLGRARACARVRDPP